MDRAEQHLRMCTDRRGLESKLVSFAKGFSKHPYILAIFKVDSEYLRFPFKVKVDYHKRSNKRPLSNKRLLSNKRPPYVVKLVLNAPF